MNRQVWASLLLFGTLLVSACSPSNFLYYDNHKSPDAVQTTYTVKDIIGDAQIDILFVIDNSGSMGEHQARVAASADQFINNFLQVGYRLQWRIGMISTDVNQDPYLGFDPTKPFDNTTIDPVQKFKDAVGALGTGGSGREMTFDPVKRAFDTYPNFLRKFGLLAIVSITDAFDQSDGLAQDSFLKYLVGLKGDPGKVIFNGAYASTDFTSPPCSNDGEDRPLTYGGSSYEWLVNQTHGSYYNLCDPDFGQKLADLGHNLVNAVDRPRLFLNVKPKVKSIRVTFSGQDLKGGLSSDPKEAVWYYDPENNCIVFNSLDFAPDDKASVEVFYVPDDGRKD